MRGTDADACHRRRGNEQYRIEVGAVETAIEVQAGTRGFGGFKQGDVELAAAHRPDHLRIVAAIPQQLGLAVQRMHHAAAHHHRLVEHRGIGFGRAQRVQAAFGQRQVDRAAAGIPGYTGIAAALEHIDLPATLREQGRQQCAGEAGTNDGDAAGFGGCGCGHVPAPRQAATARAKRNTSAWVL